MNLPPDIPNRPAGRAVGRGKAAAARACAVLSLLCFCAFAAVLAYVALGNAGCWGGAWLTIASAAVLCVPGLVLLVVAARLRPRELLWLSAAVMVLGVVTAIALHLMPGPECSGII